MRVICLLVLSALSSAAWADQVKNLSELALLPQFCRGTQQIRLISRDPTPIKQHMATYGEAYYHLHHYCWALNTENNVSRISDDYLRKSRLTYSLADYKYFLERAPSTFSLLPEIYTSRARVFFKLKRNVEAAMDLHKAIELKADYVPAYARLSDYYQEIGDKSNAIKILEQGVTHTRNQKHAAYFISRLKELGKPFQGVPGSALQKEKEITHDDGKAAEINESADRDASQSDSVPEAVPPENSSTSQPAQDAPADQGVKPNPYCRFCP